MTRNTQIHENCSKKTFFEHFCDKCLTILSRNSLVLCLAIAVLVGFYQKAPSADPDLFARLAVGRLVASEGVYLFDPFAFTERKALFIDHEWFAGYFFYNLSLFQKDWIFALSAVIAASLSMYLLSLACAEWNRARVHLLSFLVGAMQCSYVWTSIVRAQIFTYLMLPLVLLGIVRLERRNSAWTLYVLPLAMLIWANSHGGFVSGFGILAIYAFVLLLRRDWRRLWQVLVCMIACLAVTSINPYGFTVYWGFVLDAVTMQRHTISEWRPLSLSSPGDAANYIYFGIIIFGMLLSRRRLDLVSLFLFLAAATEAVIHQRLAAIAAMIGMVFCQDYFEAVLYFIENKRPAFYQSLKHAGVFVFALLGGAALFLFMVWIWKLPSLKLKLDLYPVEALESVRKSGASGRLLIDFNRGSFALWRLYPKFRVSLDGRYEEVYPESTVKMVSDALDPANVNFKESFIRINPDFVLIEAGRSFEMLANLPREWRVIYHDEVFCVLSRQELSLPFKDALDPVNIWEPMF